MFRIGTKIKIEFAESPLQTFQASCEVLQIKKDTLILDTTTLDAKYLPLLYEGRELRVFAYGFFGINILESIVMTAPFDGHLEVEIPQTYKNIQRRQYVRANLSTVMLLFERDDLDRENGIKTQTQDIGGNGIRFICHKKLEFEHKYNMVLYLSQNQIVTAECSVTIIKNPQKGEYVIEFTKIDENQRDKIIRTCLGIQSRMLKGNMQHESN